MNEDYIQKQIETMEAMLLKLYQGRPKQWDEDMYANIIQKLEEDLRGLEEE